MVPYKEPVIEKVFYQIGEVAEMFSVKQSLIRFWEQEFDIIKPKKNKKGNRLFTKQDIENIRLIFHLVKEKGMTLNGAKQKLKVNIDDASKNFEAIKKLQLIKEQLLEIKNELEQLKES
ncbi:MAG: MerR family transcriptional regulator [Bacteroidetes bacterium GWA2_32_17]|nr:MAG: MerR family transcriptional regulator [Bacteroidetes bacterium GWA2_32_17]